MAALDTPPGLGLPGIAVGWFTARPGPRRLARVGFVVTAVATVIAVMLTARRPPADHGAARMIVCAIGLAIAAVALAVRQARIGVAGDGVRWGWGAITVRMEPRRIAEVRVYRDAIALASTRGSPWFLFARDWDRFEALRRTVAVVGRPTRDIASPAPWSARLQGYGRVVDALALGAMVATVGTALAALA